MEITRKRYTCAETAQLIRAALKEKFGKATKFSVRSDTYAGGASIRVKWTDGPTVAAVDAVVKPFEGATFDGMIDLKSYKDDILVAHADGSYEQISYGADYVHTDRSYSPEALATIADEIEKAIGTRPDFTLPRYRTVTKPGRNGKNRHVWEKIEGTYNGDGWNARLPIHVDRDTGEVFPLSNDTEYGNVIVHRALAPRSL